MRAKFIGADGSMGLCHGKTYEIRAISEFFQRYPIIIDIHNDLITSKLRCPYGSLEAFAKNWDLNPPDP